MKMRYAGSKKEEGVIRFSLGDIFLISILEA